jgi:hypothetical protein
MKNPFLEPAYKPTEEPTEPTMLIDGAFDCLMCGETCDEGEYFPNSKKLKWDCSNGHTSTIEFNLGA